MLTEWIRAAPADPMRVQVEQAVEIASRVLDAQLSQIIGLVLVIVVVVLAVFAFIFLRMIGVVQRQVDANEHLGSKINSQYRELRRQSIALDDHTLVLNRIADTSKDNLTVNKERAVVHDTNAVNIAQILANQKTIMLALDTNKTLMLAKFDALRVPVSEDPVKTPPPLPVVSGDAPP